MSIGYGEHLQCADLLNNSQMVTHNLHLSLSGGGGVGGGGGEGGGAGGGGAGGGWQNYNPAVPQQLERQSW